MASGGPSPSGAGQCQRGLHDVGVDAVHQPEGERPVGVERDAGHQHVLGHRRREQAGEALGARRGGEETELHLRHPEPGRRSSEAQVAGERQLTASSEGDAVDRCDGRRRTRGEPVEDVGQAGDEAGEVGCRLQPVELGDVGTGREGAPLSGDDDRPCLTVGLDPVECVVQQGDGVGADRVELDT